MTVSRDNSKKMRAIKERIRDTYSTCFFCGQPLKREDRTIDHFISLKRGGSDSEDNMVVSCHQCNNEKSDMDVLEYVSLKLQGFDFKARAEENKRKKGFGYEGALYEESIIPMNKLIYRPLTPPSAEKVAKRKAIYLDTNSFVKPTYVKKSRDRYIILQGFINYMVLQELGEKYMPAFIVLNPPKK